MEDPHDAGTRDATSELPESPAPSMETEAGSSDAGGDAMAPSQHPGCRRPLLENDVTYSPPIHTDARGRPAIDLWRDVDCANVLDYPLCAPGHLVRSATWACDDCLYGANGADAGVCLGYADACEFASVGERACTVCIPMLAKARACCLGLAGFDCRPWPYAGDSQLHEPCARHEDCEPGLRCGSVVEGKALCVCPDESGYDFVMAGCTDGGT
ncbi:MAG: hypothetical protein QM778_23725 [Myxococcales bacterium]